MMCLRQVLYEKKKNSFRIIAIINLKLINLRMVKIFCLNFCQILVLFRSQLIGTENGPINHNPLKSPSNEASLKVCLFKCACK